MKVAGLNGVPPEALKSMGEYCRKYAFNFIKEFWHNRADFESWNKSQCVPVPKSGDFLDPNKWRGVMLMDVMSKIFSCVINIRCFKVLDAHGKNPLWWEAQDWLQQWPLWYQVSL